jgi:hypothetical protein
VIPQSTRDGLGFDALEKLDAAIFSLCEFIRAVDADADLAETEKEKEQIKCR